MSVAGGMAKIKVAYKLVLLRGIPVVCMTLGMMSEQNKNLAIANRSRVSCITIALSCTIRELFDVE